MLSDGFCESMLKTVMHFGPIAIKEPNNFEARGEMLRRKLVWLLRTSVAWPLPVPLALPRD